MKNGFLKVAVTTPDLRVADCEYNKNQMVEKVKKMAGEKVKIKKVLTHDFEIKGKVQNFDDLLANLIYTHKQVV